VADLTVFFPISTRTVDNVVDKAHLTSQNARIHAVFNKLPVLEAKIYVNKINNLAFSAASHQTPDEANSYKNSKQGITSNGKGKCL
jgi:hypothetical protein